MQCTVFMWYRINRQTQWMLSGKESKNHILPGITFTASKGDEEIIGYHRENSEKVIRWFANTFAVLHSALYSGCTNAFQKAAGKAKKGKSTENRTNQKDPA